VSKSKFYFQGYVKTIDIEN